MSEMVERVAIALYSADGMQRLGDATEDWLCDKESIRARYRSKARAAIAAMREPAEAMIEAGEVYDGTSTAEAVWLSMIDAALQNTAPPSEPNPSQAPP